MEPGAPDQDQTREQLNQIQEDHKSSSKRQNEQRTHKFTSNNIQTSPAPAAQGLRGAGGLKN